MDDKYEKQIEAWGKAGIFPRIVHLPHGVTGVLQELAETEGVSLEAILQEGAARVMEDRGRAPEEL